MKRKVNLGTLIIILFLLLAVLGMTIYIIMDKLNQKNGIETLGSAVSHSENNISDLTKEKNAQVKYEDAEFFDDYLYTFLPKTRQTISWKQ